MPLTPISSTPERESYDVVIVGGAVVGSSAAWFLSSNPDFGGQVLVVERDMSYENSSTAHTNSCMRQQFSTEINIRISQFAAEFVRNFRHHLGDDPEVPELAVNHFGYMYLASDEDFATKLRASQALQASLGAGTAMMSPAEISAAFPFYNLDDIICGSHNVIDEGYFDSGTMFDWLRRKARQKGVEYVANEVVSIDEVGDAVTRIHLLSGESISCGAVVNASGPRAARTARMAGLTIPIEPRKRYTFMFNAAAPLDRDLPLTIDPSGIHVRSDGDTYMVGCTPDFDPAVDYNDFAVDQDIWEDKVWPVLAHRIPAFERIKVISRWAGHYAHNRLDQNLVVGPHDRVRNFIFANGFSGHGMQQSPAVGRGVSELITYGEYRSLDLTPLGYGRIVRGQPFIERAII